MPDDPETWTNLEWQQWYRDHVEGRAGDPFREARLRPHEGPALTVRGQRLGITPPPRTPLYLGALGPRMLELGGEAADGICLNWSPSDFQPRCIEGLRSDRRAARRQI